MADKELIKQEIERLKEHTAKCGYPGQGEFENGNREGRNWVCDKLLSFIDSIPEEPSVKGITWEDVNTLESLIYQVHNEYPHGIGEKSFGLEVLERFQGCQEDVEEHDEDLEEEYENYFKKHEMDIVLNPYSNCKDIARHFAEWQKQQMKEALQTEYEKGRFDMREEMMKDAVEGVIDIRKWPAKAQVEFYDRLPDFNVRTGDKVKIIIVKEEQQ